MIEINLIPDIKQQYLRARRMRNYAISISIFAGIVSAGLIVFLLLLLGGQAVFERSVDNGINSEYDRLSNTESINEAITLQHQLGQISSLNSNKIIGSRLFDVLQAINPKGENESRFTTVQFMPIEKTLHIEGIAVNGYPAVEALKKTAQNTKIEYNEGGTKQSVPLTSSIIDGDSSLGEDGDGRRVLRFQMTLTYADQLFSNTLGDAKIVSPQASINVTDSRVGVPNSLFSAPADDVEGEE